MKEDIQKLLDHCVEYATDLLVETNESYPFGGFIDTIGNPHPLEMEIDLKKVPTIGKVVETLTKFGETELAEKRILGYAVTYEVEVAISENEVQNCIAIDIKYEGEELPIFYLPFSWESDKTVVGELFAVKR
jgi:hypothetical protein